MLEFNQMLSGKPAFTRLHHYYLTIHDFPIQCYIDGMCGRKGSIGKSEAPGCASIMKTFTSTRNLKENAVLRVYRKGYGYAKLTVIDCNNHFFAAISPEDFFRRMENHATIDAYLWREYIASYEFRLNIVGSFITDAPILCFAHTDTISCSLERKCLMASVSIPFRFYTFAIHGKHKSFYTEEIVFLNGTIVGISDREAVFISPANLPLTCLIKGHAIIDGRDTEITGKISSYASESERRMYTIEYAGMSEKERNRILDYVFTIYRE